MTIRHRRIRASLTRALACCGLPVALLLACPLFRSPAMAQIATCTLTGTSLTFGTIDVFATSSTSGNASFKCNAVLGGTVYFCLSIGTGTGGTTATNRTLASGSNKIPIQITGGASWPTQIGNGTSFPMEGPLSMTVPFLNSNTASLALAVTLPPPSPLPPAGTYSSTFTGTDFQAVYNSVSLSPPSSCGGGLLPLTTNATLTITATVVNQCQVAASNMNFGTAGVLTAALTATSTISVNCNASIPVTIALDNGATGTSPTTRLMTSGAKTVTYGIYRDSAHTLPWGASVGTNTGTANGPNGTVTAFGLVPAQTTPAPGSYMDVVNVTATY